MPISDDQIDALLSQNDNLIEIAQLLHERKRKLAHDAAKLTQPVLGLRAVSIQPVGKIGEVISVDAGADTLDRDALTATLQSAWNAPITDDEKSAAQGDIEYLILTIQDCVDSGDAEDLIFACLRLSRKLLARNPHLWRAQDLAAQ
jgi:hypothetical protein